MSTTKALTDSLLRIKQRRREEGDQEGWIVAYADLITLLFIFFSLLLSISVVSRAKLEMISQQFNQAATTSLTQFKKDLDAEIQRQGLASKVSTQLTDEGLQVQFSEGVLFATADASLNSGGTSVLQPFGKLIKGMGKDFRVAVEGHTDSRPIHSREFPSNWALSSARAVNVLHFLKEGGVDEKKLMVRAYANTRPLPKAKEDEESILAKNRRVTILVY